MKRELVFTLFILFLFTELNAQKRNGLLNTKNERPESIILSVGPGYCLGDIQGSPFSKIFSNGFHNYNASVGFRHKFPSNFSYRASVHYGNYALSSIGDTRGFSFESNIVEMDLVGEYPIFWSSTNTISNTYMIYVFGGAGFMTSHAKFTGTQRTGDTYKAIANAPYFSIGTGYQYHLSKTIALGAELGLHYIFSDYVDGFSTPQSKFNDNLIFLNINLVFNAFGIIKNNKCMCNWN